jgi:hypothetical protein
VGSFGCCSKVHVARGPFLQRANAPEASRLHNVRISVTCTRLDLMDRGRLVPRRPIGAIVRRA